MADSKVIRQIPINGFDSNFSYFIGDGKSKEIAIVDPGDPAHLEKEISEGMFVPKMILLTHTHADHQEGVLSLSKKYGIPVYVHHLGRGRVNVPENLLVFLEDKEVVDIGGISIKVLYTPGHIDDALCYFMDGDQAPDGIPKLLTGDTLFVEGCGRADLPNSDAKQLYKSLERIKMLPDETEIYSGHDYGSKPISTLGWEKQHNKYMACNTVDEFIDLRLPLE